MAYLDSGGPIEFLLPGSGDAYLDLANTYLFVGANVTRENGAANARPTWTMHWVQVLRLHWKAVQLHQRGQRDATDASIVVQRHRLANRRRQVSRREHDQRMIDGAASVRHGESCRRYCGTTTRGPVPARSFPVPVRHTHKNLFIGMLPKRLVMGCIDNDAYNDSCTKNPFHAKHNDIDFLALYVEGRQVPAKHLQPNFTEGRYIRSYFNLFASTGKVTLNEWNGLTRANFSDGFTLFSFVLKTDAYEGSCFHLAQMGNLRIDMHFATALVQTVNVVV